MKTVTQMCAAKPMQCQQIIADSGPGYEEFRAALSGVSLLSFQGAVWPVCVGLGKHQILLCLLFTL